jgi:lipopolysaccharide export system permease protein
MTLFDRYLLRTFVKVLAVSFLSLTGLFIIIDLFGNLEEFISYAEREGSLLRVLFGYYGARVLSFFDRISGLLALIAAIFTITWFRRTNELTAVMAAGIPKARIVRPLVAATVIVALLAAANREVGLPQVRDKLSRNAQDWLGDSAKRLTPRRDNQTQILITGKATVAAHRQINQPSFRLPNSLVEFGRQLVARQATYQPATDQHAGGYLLEGVTQPANLAEIPSARQDGKPVILSPKDNPWLKPGECFVASEITFEHLAADVAWCQFSSTPQLIQVLRSTRSRRHAVVPGHAAGPVTIQSQHLRRHSAVSAPGGGLLRGRTGLPDVGQYHPGPPGPGRVAPHADLPAPCLCCRVTAMGVRGVTAGHRANRTPRPPQPIPSGSPAARAATRNKRSTGYTRLPSFRRATVRAHRVVPRHVFS